MKKNKYNNKYNRILSFLFLFGTIFMGIGYATVNSVVMEIGGVASAMVRKEVFIRTANVIDTDSDMPNAIINDYYQTMLNSTVMLDDSDPNSSITFEVTIYNTTDDIYKFTGVEYILGDETYSNEDIVYYLTNLNDGHILKKGDFVTFNITFHYKDNIIPDNNILNSYLTFVFEPIRTFSITYIDIPNLGYPTTVYEGENLEIVLTESMPRKVNVTNVESFTYNNTTGKLNINNVYGDIIIRNIGDISFPIVGDGDIVEIVLENVSPENPINVRDLFELTLGGENMSTRVINEIDVIYSYISTTGSNQSMNSTLTVNSNTYTRTVQLRGKTNGDVTITFDNLNIGINESFSIENDVNKITNGNIDITNMVVKVYFAEN